MAETKGSGWSGASSSETVQRQRYETLLKALTEVQKQLLGVDARATVAAALDLEHARGLAEASGTLEPELVEAARLAVAEVLMLVPVPKP